MCGILGIVGQRIERDRMELMAGTMRHRGPDASGILELDDGALAHRRLSILDTSAAANQPFVDHLGRAALVFNGEIYNYRELMNALAPGWRFKSNSDTETILAAFEKWGTDCLSHLRGMFAFALWDERQRRLFCARDRFGIKPFYYAVIGDMFVFASEAKALLPFLPDIDTDPEALAEYLTLQYTIGAETLFQGIKQLLPGRNTRIKRKANRIGQR